MKLGMPALVEYTSVNELVELCLKLKLDFIELNMNLPYNFIENINPSKLKKITQDKGIEFTMHMPDDADIGTFYESVREGYVKLFSDTIDWAERAGIKLLNMHIIEGAKMTLPDRKVYIYEQYSDEFTNNFIKSIESLSKKAVEKDVIVAIENSSNFGKAFIQKTLDRAITYPNIKLTWDTGHDAVSSFTDREYLMRNEKSIAHMHVHDFKDKKDHQVLFEGELDIIELMNFADNKDIRALVEVKTAEALEKSIYALREKTKQLS